jgi:hypothetical protein
MIHDAVFTGVTYTVHTSVITPFIGNRGTCNAHSRKDGRDVFILVIMSRNLIILQHLVWCNTIHCVQGRGIEVTPCILPLS